MKETHIKYEGKTIPFYVHEPLLTRYGRLPDYISGSIEENNTFFEIGLLDYWKTKFGTITSFVDVGANIGNHSVFAREVLGATNITCFEPLGASAEILRRNVPTAIIHQVGIGAKAGEMAIDQNIMEISGRPGVYAANAGASELIPGKGIQVNTLDSFGITFCDLLKLDVEGMESQVILGATDTLKRVRPIIYAEANYMVNFIDLVEVLTPLDYYMTQAYHYGNVMIEFTPKEKL